MKNKKEKQADVKSKIISFETFRNIGLYEITNLKRDYPTCFNGQVSVLKYKITVEQIEEPNEVYVERLNKLWAECDNSHHWTPLRLLARKYGAELNMDDVGKIKK
jgi:hypothetical protein